MIKIFIVILFLISSACFAQTPPEVACRSNTNGLVYRDPAAGLVNTVLGILLGPGYGSQINPPVNQYGPCVAGRQYYYRPRTGLGTACRICPTGFILNGLSLLCNGEVSTGSAGTLVDVEIINCNLDDYTFPLTATAGLLGIFFIRKRKLF